MSYTCSVKNIVFIEKLTMKANKWFVLCRKIYQWARNLMILGIMFRAMFLDTEKLNMLKPLIMETIGKLI